MGVSKEQTVNKTRTKQELVLYHKL